MKDRLELVGIDPFPVIPNRVVFGIDLEYVGCLLQKFRGEITLSDLGANTSTSVKAFPIIQD
jgi:hypothetical protein